MRLKTLLLTEYMDIESANANYRYLVNRNLLPQHDCALTMLNTWGQQAVAIVFDADNDVARIYAEALAEHHRPL